MRRAFRDALIAITAVLASFGVMYGVCIQLGVNASPAVLAAALAVGLARSEAPANARSYLVKLIALPILALVAALVGLLFLTLPIVGALLFSFGIALSIWLRRFGERGRSIGRVVALPLVMMLVVPVRVDVHRGPDTTILLVLGAGVIALLCASAARWIAEHSLEQTVSTPSSRPSTRPRVARPGAMSVEQRMALQMLSALLLAFAIGMLAFPKHWPWIVLSAFIVCSGAVGRGDALYKGFLRFGGALAGTVSAAFLAHAALPSGVASAALIFGVLFVGLWLRQINYAFWAACATLLFALLQGSQGEPALSLLLARLIAIVIGVLCAIFAVWFVYPIRTEQMVRRRVADLLHALRELLEAGEVDWSQHQSLLDHHIAQLERIAPPIRLRRRLFALGRRDDHATALLQGASELLAHMRYGSVDRKHLVRELGHLRAMLQPKSPP